tara:strand:- start:276 stop:926 length:651 start_codon:yes stop_codon:yes gene_type:complete
MTEFIAAAGAGLAQVAIGHPFDTIKVNIQNKKNWKVLKPRQLYRGAKYPLVSSTFFNCTVFPTYEKTKKHTNSRVFSGFLSGLLVTPVVFFFDTATVLRQTGQKVKLRNIINGYGKWPTLTRECIAMSVYFSSYDYLKTQNINPLLCGSMAGVVNWSLTYPIDVVRNRQMAQNIGLIAAVKQKNFWKGFNICLTRAVVVNAGIFGTYEYIKSKIDN